jgi:hypothetical protein
VHSKLFGFSFQALKASYCLVANGCVGSVATMVLLGFYFIMWLGLHCPILCEFENIMRVFPGVCFVFV